MCGGWRLLTTNTMPCQTMEEKSVKWIEMLIDFHVKNDLNRGPLLVECPDPQKIMNMPKLKGKVEWINMCGAVWTPQKQKSLNYKFHWKAEPSHEVILIHEEDRNELNDDLLSHMLCINAYYPMRIPEGDL